jgi:hypothetical protein
VDDGFAPGSDPLAGLVMKQRQPKRRKTSRQSPKRLSPSARKKGMAPEEALLLVREAADQAAFKAEVKEEVELRDTTDATVVRAAAHKQMLSWIEVLEGLIVELPKQRRGIGHNLQPITQEEVEEATHAVAVLKAQPVAPKAPDEAKAAASTLKKIGERLGTYLDNFLLEASKSGGKEFGKQLARAPYWWALWHALKNIIQSVAGWLP